MLDHFAVQSQEDGHPSLNKLIVLLQTQAVGQRRDKMYQFVLVVGRAHYAEGADLQVRRGGRQRFKDVDEAAVCKSRLA